MSPIGGAVLTAEVDQPLTAFDFIDEDEYVASRFYREWCAPQGYFDMLGVILMKSHTDVSAMSTVRSRAAGRFGLPERAFVEAIAPHVRRAVVISGLLEARELERDMLATVTDALSAAMFVLDTDGRVLRLNPAADAMIAAGRVALRDKALVLGDASAQAALRQAMAHGDGRPCVVPFKTKEGETYIAALLSVRAGGPFALLINQDTPQSPGFASALCQAFGFTPRELTVVLSLMKGQSIEAVADELGIEVPTARSHLHKIFVKTGTSRQGELIQKIAAALPPITIAP